MTIALILIVCLSIFVMLFISKGWRKLIPLALGFIIIGGVLLNRKLDDQNQQRADEYQLHHQTVLLGREEHRANQYRYAYDRSRNQITAIPKKMKHRSRSAKLRTEHRYQHEQHHSADEYNYYQGLMSSSRSNIKEARQSLRH